MSTHTLLENTKLSPWYYAVHWAIMQMQNKITELEVLGIDATYDMSQLARLQDLEQFLAMSWSDWMGGFETAQTEQEVQ